MWQWQWKSLRPHRPKKSREKLEAERMKKIKSYIDEGILKTPELIEVFKNVPREDFVPEDYRDYSYREAPLPLPALEGTISRPHSYPLFYEAMNLRRGDYFLEIGTGSGYGAALAREIVGDEGRVISLEIDRSAYEFARANLTKHGYNDIVLIRGDGYLGYEPEAPYDKISVTAAVPNMPEPFLDQLKEDGLAVAPVGPIEKQNIMLIRKDGSMEIISESAVFVPMIGRYSHKT